MAQESRRARCWTIGAGLEHHHQVADVRSGQLDLVREKVERCAKAPDNADRFLRRAVHLVADGDRIVPPDDLAEVAGSRKMMVQATVGDQKDLTALDAEGLFPRSTTWIGFRRDIVLRRYMLDFVQLFAPHISTDQLEKTRHVRSQADIDKLFQGSELPVRGGCSDDMTAAA